MNYTPFRNFSEEDVFAAYSLPGTTDYHLVVQNKQILYPVNFSKRGFVVSPFFQSLAQPIFQIMADEEEINENFSFRTRKPIFSRDISKKQYIVNVEKVRNELRKIANSKVILSRTKSVGVKLEDWAAVFRKLVTERPSAFVFMYNTPQHGTWMGASPELLLSQEKGLCRCMALAGTMPMGDQLPRLEEWNEKERREHQIVVDFYKSRLEEFGVTRSGSATTTMSAAEVCHLRTDFEFVFTENPKNLLARLHPSPALLGWPEMDAKTIISKFEESSRGYYCGYIGPTDHDKTELYVNLRSIKCAKNNAVLYAGGGILPDSNAENEWEETELKMNTMLEVLELVNQEYSPT